MKVVLTRFLYVLDKIFDKVKFRIRKALGLIGRPKIEPYLSYGAGNIVYIKGRVLEEKKLKASRNEHSVWLNIRNMIRRFASNEVADCTLKAVIDSKSLELNTDHEGYFDASLPGVKPSEETVFYRYTLELTKAPVKFVQGEKSAGEVLVPGNRVGFGIISDIDDTILRTYATSWWRMMWLTFSGSASSRLPFHGVAAWYRSLEKGAPGNQKNPIFYVSSSPWNLYDLLMQFLEEKNIPKGPLLLKDYGIDKHSFLSAGHMGHKYKEIKQILETYPQLPFILIGDSGQQDPQIYQRVIQDFPGRITAVYIRDVKARRGEAVNEMGRKTGGVPFLLVKDSFVAAEDCVERGFINSSALSEINTERVSDEKA